MKNAKAIKKGLYMSSIIPAPFFAICLALSERACVELKSVKKRKFRIAPARSKRPTGGNPPFIPRTHTTSMRQVTLLLASAIFTMKFTRRLLNLDTRIPRCRFIPCIAVPWSIPYTATIPFWPPVPRVRLTRPVPIEVVSTPLFVANVL